MTQKQQFYVLDMYVCYLVSLIALNFFKKGQCTLYISQWDGVKERKYKHEKLKEKKLVSVAVMNWKQAS